jgi:hypothetical protein
VKNPEKNLQRKGNKQKMGALTKLREAMGEKEEIIGLLE